MAKKKSADKTKRNVTKIGFSTAAIHVGQEPDPSTGAVVVPIFATSTYVQEGIGKNKGYEYARVSNPTRTRLEINLAALEGAASAHVFASGMAAVTAVTQCFLKQGDHLICCSSVFGSTYTMVTKYLIRFGITSTLVPAGDNAAWEAAVQPNTKMVYLETPTNPQLEVLDLEWLGQFTKKRQRVGFIVSRLHDHEDG